MRIALVKNGIVDNVVEASAEWAAQHGGVETEMALSAIARKQLR